MHVGYAVPFGEVADRGDISSALILDQQPTQKSSLWWGLSNLSIPLLNLPKVPKIQPHSSLDYKAPAPKNGLRTVRSNRILTLDVDT
jgi:hypothetical protein